METANTERELRGMRKGRQIICELVTGSRETTARSSAVVNRIVEVSRHGPGKRAVSPEPPEPTGRPADGGDLAEVERMERGPCKGRGDRAGWREFPAELVPCGQASQAQPQGMGRPTRAGQVLTQCVQTPRPWDRWPSSSSKHVGEQATPQPVGLWGVCRAAVAMAP